MLLIEDFIRALRAAGVGVSVSETLDAHAAIAEIGIADRELLKDALALTLAKTTEDKRRFAETFDIFFVSELPTVDDMNSVRRSMQSQLLKLTFAPRLTNGNWLVQMLLAGDSSAVAMAIVAGGESTNVNRIRYATQINVFTWRILHHIGIADIDAILARDTDGRLRNDQEFVSQLTQGRSRLIADARSYVERQFLIYGRYAATNLREEILRQAPLFSINRRDRARMRKLIRCLAKRLADRYSNRRKIARRGTLDVSRTLRANIVYEGVPFDVRWKKTRIDRPKFLVVCDISRSVAASAEFLLSLLYYCNKLADNVKSYAFTSNLTAIDHMLEGHAIEDAIDTVLERFGYQPSDYGRALAQLQDAVTSIIDRRTTVIFLGDARSNYTNPRTDVVAWLSQRAKRVVWLNPEPEKVWGSGDSEMLRYRTYCDLVRTVRTLDDLERAIEEILSFAVRR